MLACFPACRWNGVGCHTLGGLLAYMLCCSYQRADGMWIGVWPLRHGRSVCIEHCAEHAPCRPQLEQDYAVGRVLGACLLATLPALEPVPP